MGGQVRPEKCPNTAHDSQDYTSLPKDRPFFVMGHGAGEGGREDDKEIGPESDPDSDGRIDADRFKHPELYRHHDETASHA